MTATEQVNSTEINPEIEGQGLRSIVFRAIYSAESRPDIIDYPRRPVGVPIDFDDMPGLPDTAIVNDPDNYFEYLPADHLIFASSAVQLRAVMEELESIQNYGFADEYDDDTIHEAAHAYAAIQTGFPNPKIGLRLVGHTHASMPDIPETEERPSVYFNAFCNYNQPAAPITKLGFAAICIAPTDPSDSLSDHSDLKLLQRTGYEGVDDVVDRIKAFNAQDLTRPLPLPAHLL